MLQDEIRPAVYGRVSRQPIAQVEVWDQSDFFVRDMVWTQVWIPLLWGAVDKIMEAVNDGVNHDPVGD